MEATTTDSASFCKRRATEALPLRLWSSRPNCTVQLPQVLCWRISDRRTAVVPNLKSNSDHSRQFAESESHLRRESYRSLNQRNIQLRSSCFPTVAIVIQAIVFQNGQDLLDLAVDVIGIAAGSCGDPLRQPLQEAADEGDRYTTCHRRLRLPCARGARGSMPCLAVRFSG